MGFIVDSGDEAFWVPHHLIDTSHMIFPQGIVDRASTPPGSPGLFDAYLVTATATGAWVGYEDYIAISVCDKTSGNRVWVYVEAMEGQLVWVADEDIFYIYDGDEWVNFPVWVANNHDIGDIRDVTIVGVNDNDFLIYDSASGDWINISDDDVADILAALTNLSELADVTGSDSPDSCDVLKGNGAGLWTKGKLPLNCLSDVVISGPTAGQVLYFNGTNWVNIRLDCDDVDNASNAAGATVCDALDGHETRLDTAEGNITDLDDRLNDLEGGGSGPGAFTGSVIGGIISSGGVGSGPGWSATGSPIAPGSCTITVTGSAAPSSDHFTNGTGSLVITPLSTNYVVTALGQSGDDWTFSVSDLGLSGSFDGCSFIIAWN